MFKAVSGSTEFPSIEEANLAFWEQNGTFQKSLQNRKGNPEFLFYDGPPFATGLPHYGHILAGTIKDVIPRYQTMRGKYCERTFGWDCHGLPVEYEMEKQLKLSGKKEIEEAQAKTLEQIEAFRQERGLSFPMGRDEDQKLLNCVDDSGGVPRTVIVDRFGNAVFYHAQTFRSVADIRAVLNAFTGDGYTESKVLDAIPQDTSTQVFPVSKAQAIYPEESSKYKKLLIYADILPNPWPGYIVTDDPVRLRIEISANDNPATIQYYDDVNQGAPTVESLLEPEIGAYVFSQHMPGAESPEPWLLARLNDKTKDVNPVEYAYCILVRDEKVIDAYVQYLNAGDQHARWEYAEETAELPADGQKAYVIHVVDQDGNPVEEVTVNFCTDMTCTPQETDEAGMISFEGEPCEYHVQIVDVPEGYSYDENFDMYTTAEYGEWVLRVKKD